MGSIGRSLLKLRRILELQKKELLKVNESEYRRNVRGQVWYPASDADSAL